MAQGGTGLQKAVIEFIFHEKQDGGGNFGQPNAWTSEAASSRLNGQRDQASGTAGGKQNVHALDVQYNPATIRYSAYAHEGSSSLWEKGGGGDCAMIPSTSSINMSFDLVFHSRNSSDNAVGERMDLVARTLRAESGHMVRFSWANMRIEGKLVSFSGEYDMFDRTGKPISGHMSLTILVEQAMKEEKVLDNMD